MKKYIVWLGLMVYTVLLISLYLPNIVSTYSNPDKQAYQQSKEQYALYSKQKKGLEQEYRSYVNLKKEQALEKKQLDIKVAELASSEEIEEDYDSQENEDSNQEDTSYYEDAESFIGFIVQYIVFAVLCLVAVSALIAIVRKLDI